ncbi:hypothetical protein K439DRAFT_1261864, partial [Ramaria rubella]
ILYLTSPNAANDCIKQHITFNQCLHTTVQFICHPLQCYNCYHFGHFAWSCKSTMTCGFFSQDHPTHDCKCPSNTHLCTLCSGPHAATNPKCAT